MTDFLSNVLLTTTNNLILWKY